MQLLYCGNAALTRGDSQRTPTGQHGLALIGAKIYPSPREDFITDGVVLIKDGKIVDVGKNGEIMIPSDFERINARGMTLTAGFWNCHVHFGENKWQNAATIPAAELTQQIQDMLTRYGFTSVFDTGSVFENTKKIRQRIESGEIPGPRIMSTGEIFFPKGGLPPVMLVSAFGMMPGAIGSELDNPEQAVKLVDQKLSEGVDAIKIYAATWGFTRSGQPATMPLEVVRAVAAEAHKNGKLLLAHPSNSDGLNVAVDGGADVILHTAAPAGNWSAALVAKMKQRGVSLVPTLKLWAWEGRHARASQVAPTVEIVVDQLRAYSQAGGTILFGTDVGYVDDYDPTLEYVLMARAGMSFRQILASLTTAPAERFGASARAGKIAPGFDADITLLEGDPATDAAAFSRVKLTIRNGNIIYQAR
jgi:imidazolonepropionase-like amidohydrolase